MAQAVGGLMSVTGFSADAGGQPTKVGVAISDIVTGLFGAIGMLAALREGRGQRIDVSLLDSTLAVLINQAQNAFVSGASPGRLGNAHPNIVPYETFATADGEIAVAVGSERQWPRLCAALDLPDLADHHDYADNERRVRHRATLRPILAERFAGLPSAQWLARLDAAQVPCGPVNDVLAAFAQPQASARGMVVDVVHPQLGSIRQVASPIKSSASTAAVRSAPPTLGEHSDEILGELGYDETNIDRLRTDGVI
ncbi:MAG TPA: CaiB/BaiF CoA-transferase family protein [Candidatus Limnocylindria bacterium]|nr:CaiB/BaiF CoA-transferase family protein [Candidatus Limnocylindria bacterium]